MRGLIGLWWVAAFLALLAVMVLASIGCAATPEPVTTPVPEPESPPEWTRDSTVTTALHALAVGLDREIAACVFRWGKLHLVVIPQHSLSERYRVRARRCPPAITVARWHNHPAGESCYLSAADIRTTIDARHPWVAVSLSSGVLCWWSLAQVERAGTGMIFALPDQRLQVEYRQEIDPELLTVRVQNPASEYGELFLRCGRRTETLGLVDPETTTSFEVRVVRFCVGGPESHLGVQLEAGRYVYWGQEVLQLTEDPPPAGYLVCLDWEKKQSVLWRVPEGVDVPPLCPKRAP